MDSLRHGDRHPRTVAQPLLQFPQVVARDLLIPPRRVEVLAALRLQPVPRGQCLRFAHVDPYSVQRCYVLALLRVLHVLFDELPFPLLVLFHGHPRTRPGYEITPSSENIQHGFIGCPRQWEWAVGVEIILVRAEISRGCGPVSDAGSDRPGRKCFRYPGIQENACRTREQKSAIWIQNRGAFVLVIEFESPGNRKDRPRMRMAMTSRARECLRRCGSCGYELITSSTSHKRWLAGRSIYCGYLRVVRIE